VEFVSGSLLSGNIALAIKNSNCEFIFHEKPQKKQIAKQLILGFPAFPF